MLSIVFGYLVRLPWLLFTFAKDYYHYLRFKLYNDFCGFGLHLYVGAFGAGKTCSMVRDAYILCKRYPQLHIVTNLRLQHFPPDTVILPLSSPKDILDAPQNTLVLIDEIGTIFNSRDFAKSKDSIPKVLFQHLCQCRKRSMMIYATTQRWNFLDKQLRDITASVRVTRSHFSHPFTRISSIRVYDAQDYDLAFSNPMYSPRLQFGYVYCQSNKIRSLYDTSELIENMLKDEYISDEETMLNRGDGDILIGEVLDKKSNKKVRLNIKSL